MALRPNPVLACDLRMGFFSLHFSMIKKCWKNVCDLCKFYEIQISVSMNKILLEHSNASPFT